MLEKILEVEAINLQRQPEKLKSILLHGCIGWAEKIDPEPEDIYLEMFGEKKVIEKGRAR